MIRAVFTGSECTGKTTLAQRLAAEFSLPRSGEFSRDYAAGLGRELTAADVEPIARGQIALEEAVMAQASRVLIQDTDLISTVVYARHYYGACPVWIEAAARARRANLYLLCHPDVAWIPDPQRDRGDRREEMHGLFAAAMQEFGCRALAIRGPWLEREHHAAIAISELLRA